MSTPSSLVVDAGDVVETWELTTAARVWLKVMRRNRQNQAVVADISYGPNKVGAKIKLTTNDREMNQEMVADPAQDMFTNGLLVRVDADQNLDPATLSTDAVPTKDLLAIFAKNGNAFHGAVDKLGEIPVRRMLELADGVDATAKQKEYLEEVIDTKYRNARSQEDAVFDLSGERRRDRENQPAKADD